MLDGGNATDRVVRVGATVRKPWTAATPSVTHYLAALERAGVDVPQSFGQDEQGRLVLECIPGEIAMHSAPLTSEQLGRVGAMVREIHDASATYHPPPDAMWETAIPAPGADLVCHNDLAPWNLVVGERWVFIDWDSAAPSTRLWDLAYSAQAFTLSDPNEDPQRSAADLAAFVGGYDADDELRSLLPGALERRTTAMYQLLERSSRYGLEPWASMFTAGHGERWRTVEDYVSRHRELWLEALC